MGIIAHSERIPRYTLGWGQVGSKEKETEAIYRSRGRKDHGSNADWWASRVSCGS